MATFQVSSERGTVASIITARPSTFSLDGAIRGPRGVAGPGVAEGGTTGQVLKKSGSSDYVTVWETLSKSDMGLSNVDNTADINKPVSTAQQAALDLKAGLDEIIGREELYINAVDYGCVADGTTDNTEAFKTAMSAANTANRPLYIPPGQYKCGALYRAFMPRIYATMGTVTILSTNDTDTTWNFGTTSLGPSVNLTSNAVKNATTLAVDTSTFLANDLIVVTTNAADNGTVFAQTVRVLSIDSSTQMTIADPLYKDFNTADTGRIRLVPRDQKDGYVTGIKFKNAAATPATSTGSFLRIYYGQNMDIDVEGEGAGNPGVTMEGCYQFRVKHVANRYYDQTITGLSQFGYGVNISGPCAHGEVNVIADQVRHAVSFNGTPNNIRVSGVAHATTSTAWDAHQGAENIIFDNCQAFGCRGFGFALRGKRQHVQGGVVSQCYGGVFLFDSPGDNEIKNLRISALRDISDGNTGNGIVVSKAQTGLTISGNDFIDIPRSAISLRAVGTLSDVFIDNNRALNVGLSGVANERNFIRQLSSCNIARGRIHSNTVGDNQGSPTLQYGIQLAGSSNSDVSIFNNAFHNISFGNVLNGTGTTSGFAKIGRNFINGATVERITDVTYSATPIFDATASALQRITLTGNVTSSTISNPTDGQQLTIMIVQDSTGGYTFAWPSDVDWQGPTPTVTTTANAVTVLSFIYSAATTRWTSMAPSKANDDSVVHITGDETATGTKTFSTKVIAGTVPDPQGANKLDVQDVMGVLMRSANQNGPIVGFYKRGTTGDDSAAVANAAAVGSLNAYGWWGSGYTVQGNIVFNATENWSSTARGTRIEGFVTSNGATARVQTFRFDQDRSAAFYGTVKPNASNTLDFGQSNLRWNTGFINNISTNFAAKTAAYTVVATDCTLTGDATAGAFNITLLTAVGNTGRMFTIKKIDASANAVTVTTTSSQTIDGSTTYALGTQWKYVTVQSNGANWIVIGNN